MFQRRILHHGPTPQGTPVVLNDRAISGCWFELLRLGGCGAGELVLQREFHERDAIEIGDWISCEGTAGHRWYLGRVEETRYQHPGRLRIRLAGMVIELNEVFPGGFDASPNERRPIRYGDTDLFSNDPDRDWELAFPAPTIEALIRQLMQRHVVNQTHISYVPALVESPRVATKAQSAKFRGEESIRSILKDLALRTQSDWGVDPFGRFYFLRRRTQPQMAFRIGRDLTSVEQVRDRELIFNRLLLTGDYIYDHRDNSGQIARRVYRWRANYFEPDSCRTYGNRRMRLWVPWIRTHQDSVDFAREFFRLYAKPAGRYLVETLPQDDLLIPWEGPLTIEDAAGTPLATGIVEKVKVLFDHAPRFRLEIGPEDPREQWPEPPQDERWELPDHVPSHRGDVSITSFGSSEGGGGGGNSTDDRFSTSTFSDLSSSDLSSDISSSQASSASSDGSGTTADNTSQSTSLSSDSTGGTSVPGSSHESTFSSSGLSSSGFSSHTGQSSASDSSTVSSHELPSSGLLSSSSQLPHSSHTGGTSSSPEGMSSSQNSSELSSGGNGGTTSNPLTSSNNGLSTDVDPTSLLPDSSSLWPPGSSSQQLHTGQSSSGTHLPSLNTGQYSGSSMLWNSSNNSHFWTLMSLSSLGPSSSTLLHSMSNGMSGT